MKLIFIALFFIFPVAAYAYIDPGTGSLWLQYLIGGATGLYFLVKVYYGKLKAKFFSRKAINSTEMNKQIEEEVKHV